ncbi:MAG TPA: glucan biosynthesis protein G [Burkholderiaceae bacterium]|nr:glucan biosynthesis protein G [Burkholderiaceae bacterium]
MLDALSGPRLALGSRSSASPLARRCAAALCGVLLLAQPVARAFGFDEVAERARALGAAAYQQPVIQLAPALRDLDYDAYRDIRFRADRAPWRAEKVPFELNYFVTGRLYREPVRINMLDANGAVKRVEFDPTLFDFGRTSIDAAALRTLDFAGFRAHHGSNTSRATDELIVFLGASYFRAIGPGQSYGLSARGLAVDTAAAGGEEFPRFVEFWIERPKASTPAGASSLTVYGLLDSVRVAGAYKFVVTPGKETTVQVNARLFVREGALRNSKFGIAPLSSMFQFGENQPSQGDDYRPEVHDSDGLSIQTASGEWLWRPLVNPKQLLVTSFDLTDPRGFGLMQRDRTAGHYEDPEALYERRPSVWIEPAGAWGAGRVELVLIPTPDETNDNIAAYWVPAQGPVPGKPFDIAYRLRWQGGKSADTVPPDRGWVVQSRRGRGYVKQPDGDIQYVVDFDGPALRALGTQAQLEAVVEVGANGELRERNVFRNRVSGTWRMTVRVRRADASKPIELRAHLQEAVKQASSRPLTETWTYIVPSDSEKS